jgi:hypothetical protein
MSSGVARKLNLALYLNPETSEADHFAVGALREWYEKAKRSHSDRTSLEMVVRLFHRDIYLAGLYIHLLNPRLSRSLSVALDSESLTPTAFWRQLHACGLSEDGSEATTAAEVLFSPSQLTQLQQLLAEQNAHIVAVQQELQQLRQLADSQARQLKRLQGQPLASTDPGSGTQISESRGTSLESTDLSELMRPSAQLKKIKQKGLF